MMEEPVESSVHNLGASIVREYLFRKGLDETLQCMDIELPRHPESLNSRHLLAKKLNIQYILQKNKERLNPYKTMLEVIIFELIMNNGNVKNRRSFKIQLVNNRPKHRNTLRKTVNPPWPNFKRVFTNETIQELNLTQPRLLDLHTENNFDVSKLFQIKYKHLFTKKIFHGWCHKYDGLADLDEFLTSLSIKDRSRNCEKNDTEASLREYEETIKETMEYNRTHPRVYSRKSDETPLKMKEGILLDSINTSIDSSTYNNKNRLGPNKENTFQCLKRSRSTSSMSNTVTNSSSNLELQLNEDCDNPLRSKSRSINLPHQLHVSLDLESNRDEIQCKSTKDDVFVDNVLSAEENTSVNVVYDLVSGEKENIVEVNEETKLEKSDISSKEIDKKETIIENKDLESKCSFRSIPDHNISNEETNFDREIKEISLDKSVNKIPSHNSSNIISEDSLNNRKSFNKTKETNQMFGDKEVNNEFNYVNLETVTKLKNILIQSALTNFSYQWMGQSFILNRNPKLQYGFVQNKGGACGVLATVQGFLLKSLLFNPSFATANLDPLRPTVQEVRSALIQAFCDILWQAGQYQQAVLVCLSEESHLENTEFYRRDDFTEFLCYKRFTSLQDLQASVDTHLSMFTSREGKGCLLFIISAILSRGINSMLEDMDDDTCDLIASNGTCALELVTLLLTGRAVSNVFDNNMQLDSCLLKGVTKRSDIGFLSLYEHYNSCQVGSNLKTPRYPIWLVNSKNHFSVIFSARKQLVSDWRAERQFQLHHYDGMISYNDEIILHIDTTGLHLTADDREDDNIPILDLCIRTKWKDAAIKWTTNINN